MEMFTVKKREEVLRLLEENFQQIKLETEYINIDEVRGRVLSEDILSKENIPAFIRSTVDGYAVKSENTIGASDTLPAFLKLIGETVMGEDTDIVLKDYETVYVPTGGIVPSGADSMVMVEYTESFGQEIAVHTPGSKLANIVGIGDDVKENEVAIEKHTRVKSQHIGVLAALGYGQVPVFRKPRVSILSTGDEIVPIETVLAIGQIRDVNSHTLKTFVSSAGCDLVRIERLVDDFETIKSALIKAERDSDIVFLSGGSSVGNHDMTPEIINSIGKPGVLVHGVAIKPGKPTIVAKVNETAIFGLPGHPASCVISYKAIVEPFIKSILLKDLTDQAYIIARSGFQMHVSSGRDVYFMVKLVEEADGYSVEPVQGKSGMVSLFSSADGYIVIPMEKEGLKIGEQVRVRLFE